MSSHKQALREGYLYWRKQKGLRQKYVEKCTTGPLWIIICCIYTSLYIPNSNSKEC